MTLLALSGSPSAQSVNQDLLAHAASLTGVPVEQVSIRDYPAPLYSRDLESESGVPASILALKAKIDASEGVLIASPEHNGGMPAALKNTLDWLSRVAPGEPWLTKPLVLLSTSPDPNGGKTNLSNLSPLVGYWGADLVGTYSLGGFYQNFDETGLTDVDERAALTALMTTLVARATVPAEAE